MNKAKDTNRLVNDELHEECGVFGMYDFDGGDVASTIYYGTIQPDEDPQIQAAIKALK